MKKTFSIRGSASDIYAALLRDIATAAPYEQSLFEILERERNRSLRLRVTVGFVPCILTYTIDEDQHTGACEVTAYLDPYGWKWVAYQAATLGLRRHSMEMILVQALANLKAEVEGSEQSVVDEIVVSD